LTILVDASALVAILTDEPDSKMLKAELDRHEDKLYCATGAWEAVRAVARIAEVDVDEAGNAIGRWFMDLGFRSVLIGDAEWRLAVEAHRQYGKGTGHPASLNMGDCFAYACAKTNDARLLYKGDDFSKTDLA
jgi:ribonuclease VapC